MQKLSVRLVLVSLLCGLLFACGSGEYDGLGEQGALNPPQYSPPPGHGDTSDGKAAYQNQCLSCHGADGSGSPAGPSLVGCASCTDVDSLTDRIVTTMPLGNTEACGLSCSRNVAAYILGAFNGSALDQAVTVLDQVDKAPLSKQLYRASLSLAGRLPSAEEFDAVEQEGEIALERVLDELMQEPAFYARLIEIYNDTLLQNKYLGGENALSLLRDSDYPQRRWYNGLGLDTSRGSLERDLYFYLRAQTNDAVGQEALRLIEYVVRQDRPITEMLTADYLVANYFSARAYGVADQHQWRELANPPFAEYPYDPEDFRPVRLTSEQYSIPHAGVLTSTMFLNRFPTTETNRNRHRSRMLYQLFLDTDILQLGGSRPGDLDPVDISSPIPTLDNPSCLICHEVLDPVASAYQNWNEFGQYRPSHYHDGWHTDMEARGFNGKTMDLSSETVNASVRWLAVEMADDPRFATSVVKTLYQGFSGQVPLDPPPEDAAQDDPRRVAYAAQTAYYAGLSRLLIDSEYRIRPVIRALMSGPYVAANSLIEEADVDVHAKTGAARLLTPEMLDRKIHAVTGLSWQRNGRDRLLSRRSDGLLILYGGIDSDDVTSRLTEPNGIMLAIQQRMAEEMACRSIGRDFYRPQSGRYLFPMVSQQDSLIDATGQLDPFARERIVANLQHLIRVMFGRQVSAGDQEIWTYLRFIEDVQIAGRQEAEASGEREAKRLHRACDVTRDPATGESLSTEERIYEDPLFVLRAWQAVLVAMFSDFEFVYE